jgi:hypothetical protein
LSCFFVSQQSQQLSCGQIARTDQRQALAGSANDQFGRFVLWVKRGAMEEFAELDYAWAAGVIDGEGCVFIARKKAKRSNGTISDTFSVGVKVTMGHEPTILRLRAMFGSGSKHTVVQVGWNPAYTWLAQAKIAQSVLLKIRPYSITKAAEIKVAFEFLDLPGWFGGNYRGPKSAEYLAKEIELWDKMRRLKPRTRYKLEHLAKEPIKSDHITESEDEE